MSESEFSELEDFRDLLSDSSLYGHSGGNLLDTRQNVSYNLREGSQWKARNSVGFLRVG